IHTNKPAQNKLAKLKEIFYRVTSTSLDTKGADELDGTAARRRNTNGNIDPINDPHKTTPTNDKLTTNPIGTQYSPYCWVNSSQLAIRKKPNAPKIGRASCRERV